MQQHVKGRQRRLTAAARHTLCALLPVIGGGLSLASAGANAQEAPTLDSIVVTAGGHAQLLEDAPASISVITREELETRSYRDVLDALSDVPGVIVTGGSDRQEISIRGMESGYTLMLVDGRRVSSRETRPRNDGPGVENGWTPPLSAIERIEVVRGPMSSLYGSDAIGGVINIITRKVARTWTGELRGEATLQQDSHSGNAYQGGFYLSGPIKNDLLGLEVYGRRYHRGEDDIINGFRRRDTEELTTKLSLTPHKDHDLRLEVGQSEQRIRSTLGRTVAPGPRGSNSDIKHRNRNVALSHTGRWSGVTAETHLQRQRFDILTSEMSLVNIDAQNRVSIDLDRHQLTVGGSYLSQRLDDGVTNGQSSGEGRSRISRYQWALFAEDEWSLTDRFALTAGARFDHDERFGSHWSPRLYGVWHATDVWTVKGGLSTGFRAPELRHSTAGWIMPSGGGDVWGNPDLKPETTVTQEIGVLYDNRQGLSGGLTLFNNDFKDKITRVECPEALCPGGTNASGRAPTRRINVASATSRGVEAVMSWKVTPTLSLSGSYTFTESEQKSGAFQGRPLTKLPRHLLNATVDWNAGQGWRTWGRVNYRGKESPSNGEASNNAFQARSYAFVDAGLTYAVNKNLTVGAAVYNLFDKRISYDEFNFVEDGRRYWLSATLRF